MDINQPKADMKPVEIFKPGTWVASNGQPFTITPGIVRELAESYNPEFADAPYVVGHPKLTSPRFGRADKLFVNDAGVLCAESADVVPEFAEAVNAKLYPKVSASIYLPNAPGNPTPGKHYLRHVGFLGGQPPAVKGLKSVEFAEGDDGIADFAYEDRIVARTFRRMRDWIVEKFGVDEADKVLPDYDIDFLTESAMRDDIEERKAIPAFSAPNHNQEDEVDLANQKQALDTRQTELDARAAELAAREAKLKKSEFADFAEGLVEEGKLLPAQKASVVEILVQLDSANQVADFAEGDVNHGKTGSDLFRAFLQAQTKQVEFSRVTKQPGEDGAIADFAAPPGSEVDQEQLAILGKAQEYVKLHPDVSVIDACKIVAAA